MHVIEPARLLPGVTLDALPGPRSGDEVATDTPSSLLRGRALIFWDPKVPGKKLDAIDTDQITPATDCVSESLETLDERWKAGSFRFLMPDFRARVHRGETFLIAGDRFAIGSSREMSPAGLKGVAEEAGLEMGVVCGNNMGDIFRRNAFNLGLHVVQSHEAVADAQDGDELTFDPTSRRLANVTRGKTYDPVPLTSKEDEIRRSGGIFSIGRREFADATRTPPRIEWAPPDLARRMTTTEQILWAHRVDKNADVRPGSTLRCYADLLPASDGTAPFSIHTFRQITGGEAIRRADRDRERSLRVHGARSRRSPDLDRPRVRSAPRHREALLRHARRRHLPLLFPRAGARAPRSVHPRRRLAQPRVRRLRRARHRRRIDHARLRVVDRLRVHDGREAAARRVRRRAAALGDGEGHRARAAAPLGRQAIAGHVRRVRRSRAPAPDRVPQHHRQHDGEAGR